MSQSAKMIRYLYNKGYAKERISAMLAAALGVVNGPSIESIRRWKVGKGNPTGPWEEAIKRVYSAEIEAEMAQPDYEVLIPKEEDDFNPASGAS